MLQNQQNLISNQNKLNISMLIQGKTNEWELVIGLEIHAQLNSQTKLLFAILLIIFLPYFNSLLNLQV